MAVLGADLVSAAVTAAIQARAPRRTVAAVAAAVTNALVQKTDKLPSASQMPAGAQRSGGPEADDSALLASLRAVRSAARRRKKERKQASKQAVASSVVPNEAIETLEVPSRPGVAEQRAATGDSSAPASAPTLGISAASDSAIPLAADDKSDTSCHTMGRSVLDNASDRGIPTMGSAGSERAAPYPGATRHRGKGK